MPVLIFPEFDPVLIHLGPFAIRWYALAYVAGILLGWRYVAHLTKTPKVWSGSAPSATPLQIDDLVLWVTLGIILGGRIGYVLFYNSAYYLQHPAQMLELWHGGMSFHGGAAGVCVAIVLFCRQRHIYVLRFADVIACAAPIGLFLGRIANFINGELWGRQAPDLPWAMVFPNGGPVPRHQASSMRRRSKGSCCS